MESYWMKTVNKSQFEQIQDNKKADVCIIGGGLTGLTIAYYLSKTNLKVVLLERDRICESASRKNYR